MGRAIKVDNIIDDHERRLKLIEDALEEYVQNGTRVHHVDLTEDITSHGVKVEPDEEFTAPTTRKRKKVKATL